jgi:2-hydroxychromene-2-carboxylate isomerase
MGDVISITARRRTGTIGDAGAGATRRARATFSFDLSLPGTYLAAERVDQLFDRVRWQPVYAEAFWAGQRLRDPAHRDALIASARARAAALRVPLVLPDRLAADIRPVMRAAQLACDLGRGALFVLAASRLAFCGGFDLSDPEVLAEAAAAASIPLDGCIDAAGDTSRDASLEAAGRRLLAIGAEDLPVIRVGRQVFGGESRIEEAAAAARALVTGRFGRPVTAW